MSWRLLILNLTTAVISITAFQTVNLTGFNRSKTLLLALLSRFLNPHISDITPILKSLHWLKINKHIEYKLLSLTYKDCTTSQPNSPRSQHELPSTPSQYPLLICCYTLSHPPTISLLKITDRSFRYASRRLGINFQIHFVSLISPVSIHLLIHLSTHPCYNVGCRYAIFMWKFLLACAHIFTQLILGIYQDWSA